MHTDGPSPAWPFTATVERSTLATVEGPTLASRAGAVAPVRSVCIGASVVPNSCLVARRSRLPEGLVITTGRTHARWEWARQTRERAAATKPACTMRRIAKPRRHTGLLPAPQGCGTRHSKQDSTQMQKGYTLNTRMGLGPARRFTADTAQPNPGARAEAAAVLGAVREQSNQLGRVTAPCVMAGLGPATHDFAAGSKRRGGGRARPGHDTGLCGVAG